jgi:hypothetical protein
VRQQLVVQDRFITTIMGAIIQTTDGTHTTTIEHTQEVTALHVKGIVMDVLPVLIAIPVQIVETVIHVQDVTVAIIATAEMDAIIVLDIME